VCKSGYTVLAAGKTPAFWRSKEGIRIVYEAWNYAIEDGKTNN
jgi:hypothetical protein